MHILPDSLAIKACISAIQVFVNVGVLLRPWLTAAMSSNVTPDLPSWPTALLCKVWPGGLPDSDRKILEMLPPEKLEVVARRLEAVWLADKGKPLAHLAELAGLKRSAFFDLRKAWQAHSVAALVRFDSKRARGVTGEATEPLVFKAMEILRESKPSIRNIEVARRLRTVDPQNSVGDKLHELQRAERYVQAARRKLLLDTEYLNNSYGRSIIIDLTAIDIILEDPRPSHAIVAMVLDAASGLVLGSALGPVSYGVDLQVAAIDDALDFLKEERADYIPKGGPAPDLAIMLPPELNDSDSITALLQAHAAGLVVGHAGGFSFGQHAVQCIGRRIGRVALAPRRTLTLDSVSKFFVPKFSGVSLERARALWARELIRHNMDRIEALKAAKLIGTRGKPKGSISYLIKMTKIVIKGTL